MISHTLFSYIDPVSGVILLQLAIGSCLGGLTYLYRKMGGRSRAVEATVPVEAKADLSVVKPQPAPAERE